MARNVVASTYVTLDGFIDEPGLWSFPFWSEEAAQYKARELFASDALLLGRLTYEGFAAAWPSMEGTGEFGEKMNSMPKYVASHTLDTATWNATIIKGDVAEEVRRLKQDDGGDLLIGGSGQLIDFLTGHGLIDEYRLMIYPIVFSTGTKRLFATVPKSTFTLVDTLRFPTGVVVNTYHPAPPPPAGS
ncbi:MAG TPA: dihydrofolate reductase family protein [Candidatus Dormibacteraeota bacterium]|jgi:dihydrofolate reductase|nr:dihydrofolate reductase family protein [Candidatus Dormibacteraeota bacterium]